MLSKILVIEDNEADVVLLEDAFEQAGVDCEVLTIDDGEEALAHIAGISSLADGPALILLDMSVPKVSGLALLEAIRSHKVLSRAPVIAWSSTRTPKEFEQLNRLGIEGFVLKPTDLGDWLRIGERVKAILDATGAGE